MKYFAPIIFPGKVQVLEQFLCRPSVALFLLIYGLTLGTDHFVPSIISYRPTLYLGGPVRPEKSTPTSVVLDFLQDRKSVV